jgi:FtsP/CotA-like multicopper oxidase with cupredoxin domain
MKKIYSFSVVLALLLSGGAETLGQLPGQIPLNPKNVPQFVDPLPHFAGQRVDASGEGLIIRYVPSTQVAVSTGTVLANGTVGVTPGAGVARVWAYRISNDNGTTFTPAFWPAFTIEARRGIPVNVTYENKLDNETYASINLIADQTLHWADPGGDGMTMKMGPYEGPIPVSPHLHGGEVAAESDGGPNAWFTPGPAPYTGPSWGIGGTDQHYFYPNTQEEATLWFHDHALGVTRLNVYAGLAGFYLLRGEDEENARLPGWSGDDLVQEVLPPGKTGTFAPQPYLPEIEIAFQDRMFDNQGGLYYPNLAPNPMVHPYWTPEFVGDIITVNGKTWPYLSVAPRKYRFRLLNGSNARFYEIWLQDQNTGANGPQIIQIGTDGGLLDAPVPIAGKLILAPGERADVVIDFTGSAPGQVWTVRNSANTPFPKGGPPNGSTVGRLMQFIVNGKMVSANNPEQPGSDKSQLGATLRATPIVRLTDFAGVLTKPADVVRQLTLNEVMGMGGPLEVLVNNTKWDGNGHMEPGLGETEIPVEGTTELWQIVNLTADAHPIHLHLVQFQLVGRQKFNMNNFNKAYNAAFGGVYLPATGPPLPYNTPNADGALGGNPAITPFLQGPVSPALLNEQGWKDTYIVYPGEVTTFAVRFAPTDIPLTAQPSELLFGFDPSSGPGYVWHCHIIDHEDNEMMRPYSVLPSPARSAQPLALKSRSTGSLAEQESLFNDVAGFALDQNYPNPVSGRTEIKFSVGEESKARLTVFDSAGREVKVVLDNEVPAGTNTVDLSTEGLRPGVYFYRLQSGSFSDVKKMIVR